MQKYSSEIAKILLEMGAVQLRPNEPFQWSSGWHSPVYCDNRVTLSYPKSRTYIKDALAQTIRDNFSEAEVIAGVATAGIPQGALIADALDISLVYVRSKPKGHGMGNLIEGKLQKGQKIVVVEDLVSTGASSLKAVEALRAEGCEVLGMVAIMTYGFEVAKKAFEEKDVKLITLCDYTQVVSEAVNQNIITENLMASLHEWRKDPANWNK